MKKPRLEYRWVVGVIFVFGMFMNLLDITITNVALPTLAKDFHASITAFEWVVTGYLVSMAIFIPATGWAGDRFGTKKIFVLSLSIFATASLLCGLSWSIHSLISFRVLQGVGGGMLTPIGTAMLFRAFPPAARAQASSVLAIPTVVAPATGPVLGGYLVEFHSWRWIFFINVPIGILAIVLALAFLKEEVQSEPGRLDASGFVLSATGLALLLYALSQAGIHGSASAQVLGFGVGGLAFIGAFAVHELRVAEPLIDIRLLRDRLFAAANAAQLVGQSGLTGTLCLLPLLLQSEMGLTAFQSGLTTFPQAIGVALMAQPAGRLYKYIGPRRMIMAGRGGVAVTTAMFLLVGLDTSQWWIRLIMFLRGAAFAFTIVPMQTATFATIRSRDTGRASSIFNAGRQVGAFLGVAILATVLTNRLSRHGAILGDPATRHGALLAFHQSFVAGVGLASLGVLVALLISDREAAATMQREARPGESVVSAAGR